MTAAQRWMLRVEDGTTIPYALLRRKARFVRPGLVEEAICQATERPNPHSRRCVYGFDAAGRPVRTLIADMSGLQNDELAAAIWLSGAPLGRFEPVDQAETPGEAR